MSTEPLATPTESNGGDGGTGEGPLLDLRGIEKRFGSVKAVSGVDIAFNRCEVHAVLGENGAGKTTLMNILAGVLAPDVGAVMLEGRPVSFGSPRDAIDAGIGMVHQHFRLVEEFTVAENLAVGARGTPRITSRSERNARAQDLSERFKLAVEPDRQVSTLSVGEKQRVEILRILSRGTQILILDEPTAVLTPDESLQLCTTLREMASDGACIVFISHKLNEALTVADRISVLRRGVLVATEERDKCDVDTLARLMFGDASSDGRASHQKRGTPGDVVLSLKKVCATDVRGVASLRDVSFDVRQGEIVGVVGVAGNGQQELEGVATGLLRPDGGEVEVSGSVLRGSRAGGSSGIAHIPEDRLGMGLVASEPIWRNAMLRRHRSKPFSTGPLIHARAARRFAADLAASVELSTSNVRDLVRQLSGGNAQKLLAGRELAGDRTAVVAANPTQGLDIKAGAAVRNALLEATHRGLAVLLISADLDEILEIGDRILVLYAGAIVGDFTSPADRDQIGILMGGGSIEDAE